MTIPPIPYQPGGVRYEYLEPPEAPPPARPHLAIPRPDWSKIDAELAPVPPASDPAPALNIEPPPWSARPRYDNGVDDVDTDDDDGT